MSLLEQRSIEAARSAIVDVLDGGALAQPGDGAGPRGELPVGALGGLAVEQQGEATRRGPGRRRSVVLQLAEGAGHAGEAELDELIDGGMGEQGLSPQW